MHNSIDSLSMSMSSTLVLSPDERIKRFGIECVSHSSHGDGITFAAGQWKPGGEYVQKLIVRNVTTSVKKLKYKLPSTRFFSMAYPEVIILSPGMFKELDVVFRPVHNDPYDDTIYFKMMEGEGSGGFHVPVRALISKLHVAAPFGVDLGFSATHQITSQVFQLRNIGEVDAPFRWETPAPFDITPSAGVIPVGHSQDITVSISPVDASVFVAEAVCIVGEGVHAIIPEPVLVTKLSTIAKFAYIVLSDEMVDFGEVLSGTAPETTTKEIVLRNQSVVPAEFSCERRHKDYDEWFNISPRSGVIPPQSEVAVRITFLALASGCYDNEEYIFSTPGGCETVLTCIGLSMPPKVTLHKEIVGSNVPDENMGTPLNSLNFRDIEINQLVTRVFFLKNSSSLPTTFSILADEDGIFKIHPRQGVIPAEMEVAVKLTFVPTKPINYYRRIFILISEGLPLFIDVMGTGFIRAKGEVKEQRPAPLRHAHIQAYRNRCMAGLDLMSPDELDAMYENGAPKEYFAQVGIQGTQALSISMLKNPLTRSGETSRTLIAPAHELFIDDTETYCRGITVDETYVDFGYTPHNSTSQSKTITITNHTNAKVSVMWFPPAAHDDHSNEVILPVFSIYPPNAEIGSKKKQSFRVVFHPTQSNCNFVSELEIYGFFKNQRTFRLVNDSTMTPPWSLIVRAVGHTFSTGQLEARVRMVSGAVRGGKLMFPTCYVGDSQYQIIKVKNTSNLPLVYNLHNAYAKDSDIFHVKPTSGAIAANDFVLICIQFTPKQCRNYKQLIKCTINGGDGGELLVTGSGSIPQVYCPDLLTIPPKIGQEMNPRIYMDEFFALQPTAVGLSSQRQFRLKNCSRIPCRYYCSLPPGADGVMSLSPCSGFLKGNEACAITITFAPQKSIEYNFKLHVQIYPVGGQPQKLIDARQPGKTAKVQCVQDFKVRIVAQGNVGAIIFDPPRVATDVKLVNTTEVRRIALENISDAHLKYKLYYMMEFAPDDGTTSSSSVISPLREMKANSGTSSSNVEEHECLYCAEPEGILPARSRAVVPFTFQPNRSGLFQFTVYCKLQSLDADGNPVFLSNEESALLYLSQKALESQVRTDVDLPLVTHIVGRACFPTLLIDDVRTEGDLLISDVKQLWNQCSIASINYDLSLPLTDDEVHFNTISSPDLSLLKRYPLTFTPDTLNHSKQIFYLQFKNSGFLTTSFKLTLPNEKELELEPWCDEDEPTEERLVQISIIEELKCFEVEPRSGTLEPGQSMVIMISYSHSTLKYNGFHKLPVLVKLQQGKQFWLDISGRTLPTETPVPGITNFLLHPPVGSSNIYNLDPVPIGLTRVESPLQRMELFNVSALDVDYEIDMSELRQLAKQNFNRDIMLIINPKGTVLARSSHFIEWIFTPLEVMPYEVNITVRYFPRDGSPDTSRSNRRDSKLVTNFQFLSFKVRGTGYDARLPKPVIVGEDLIGAVPPVKKLLKVTTMATLSEDFIDFAVVPKNTTSHRMLVLHNDAPSEVEFHVEVDSSYLICEHLLNVFPTTGKIEPKSMAVLHFTLDAKCQPMCINDRVKISVRGLTKSAIKRVNSRHEKLKDRLRSRKMNTSEHTSVVIQPTTSRSMYIDNNRVRGKTAKYPSTANTAGELITTESGTRFTDRSVAEKSSPTNSISMSRLGASDFTDKPTFSTSCVCIVRLKGEVFMQETITNMLQKGPQKDIVDKFVMLSKTPFIPPRRVTAEDALTPLPAQTSASLDASGSARSSKSLVRGGTSAMLPPAREGEVRGVAELVLADIFRDVLSSVETKEQIQEAVTAPCTGLTLTDKFRTVGGSVYGVYFQEVIPSYSLTIRLMRELAYMRIIDTDATSRSDAMVNKNMLLACMSDTFAFNRKGTLYRKIVIMLESIAGDDVSIREFVSSLPDDVLMRIDHKLLSLENKRKTVAKIQRQTSVQQLQKVKGPVQLSDDFIQQELQRRREKKIEASKSINIAAQRSADIYDDDIGEGPTTDQEILNAVNRIQSVARGAASRAKAMSLRDIQLHEKSKLVLLHDDFRLISAEILRNTMYNLMSEAVYGEFPVLADPMKFVMRKEEIHTTTSS